MQAIMESMTFYIVIVALLEYYHRIKTDTSFSYQNKIIKIIESIFIEISIQTIMETFVWGISYITSVLLQEKLYRGINYKSKEEELVKIVDIFLIVRHILKTYSRH